MTFLGSVLGVLLLMVWLTYDGSLIDDLATFIKKAIT